MSVPCDLCGDLDRDASVYTYWTFQHASEYAQKVRALISEDYQSVVGGQLCFTCASRIGTSIEQALEVCLRDRRPWYVRIGHGIRNNLSYNLHRLGQRLGTFK